VKDFGESETLRGSPGWPLWAKIVVPFVGVIAAIVVIGLFIARDDSKNTTITDLIADRLEASEESASNDASATTTPPQPTAPPATSSDPATSTSGPPTETNSYLQVLQSLVVTEERPAGYDRDLFRHWVDTDGDGCDARREVLIEESLDPVTVGSGCSLTGGRWLSIYDGVETSDPSKFDVDHMVPLSEAWRSGAVDWNPDTRRAFANDLTDRGTLIAVSASSNRSKGDRDPANWMPPNQGIHCWYAQTWVTVKATWGLTVDAAEQSALTGILTNC